MSFYLSARKKVGEAQKLEAEIILVGNFPRQLNFPFLYELQYQIVVQIGAQRKYLRRGNFFTSRVHLNPTISTQAKYFALPRNIHSCLNLVMTVTEGGYYLAGEENNLDVNHPAILQDAENPKKPSTLFGLLVKALRKRRHLGIAPFSIMSCDNIVHNGDVTKGVIVGLAKLQEA